MRDTILERQVDVISGRAEARLQEERYEIAAQQQQREDARLAKRDVARLMSSEQALKSGMLPSVLAMTDHERRNFSVSRLVAAISKPKKESCLEVDLAESIAADIGVAPHGG